VFSRSGAHGVREFALAVFDIANGAANWRAVHVNVEYAEKNADAVPGPALDIHQADAGNLTVAGRHNCPRRLRNSAFRIAKKPQKEAAEKNRNDRYRRDR
jgi:hypothetical protein